MDQWTDPRFNLPFVTVNVNPPGKSLWPPDIGQEGGPAVYFCAEVLRHVNKQGISNKLKRGTVPRLLLISDVSVIIATHNGALKRTIEIAALQVIRQRDSPQVSLCMKVCDPRQHDLVVDFDTRDVLQKAILVLQTIFRYHQGRDLTAKAWEPTYIPTLEKPAEYYEKKTPLHSRLALYSRLKKELSERSQPSEMVEEKVKELKEELILSMNQMKDDEIERLYSIIQEYQKATTTTTQQDEQHITLSKEDLESIERERRDQQLQLQEYQQKVAQLQHTITDQDKQLEQLEEWKSEKESELGNTSQHTSKHLEDQEEEIRHLQGQNAQISGDMSVLRKQHTEAANQLETLNERLRAVYEELQEKDAQVHQNQTEVQELTEKLKSSQGREKSLQTELSQILQNVEESEKQASSLNSTIVPQQQQQQPQRHQDEGPFIGTPKRQQPQTAQHKHRQQQPQGELETHSINTYKLRSPQHKAVQADLGGEALHSYIDGQSTHSDSGMTTTTEYSTVSSSVVGASHNRHHSHRAHHRQQTTPPPPPLPSHHMGGVGAAAAYPAYPPPSHFGCWMGNPFTEAPPLPPPPPPSTAMWGQHSHHPHAYYPQHQQTTNNATTRPLQGHYYKNHSTTQHHTLHSALRTPPHPTTMQQHQLRHGHNTNPTTTRGGVDDMSLYSSERSYSETSEGSERPPIRMERHVYSNAIVVSNIEDIDSSTQDSSSTHTDESTGDTVVGPFRRHIDDGYAPPRHHHHTSAHHSPSFAPANPLSLQTIPTRTASPKTATVMSPVVVTHAVYPQEDESGSENRDQDTADQHHFSINIQYV